MNNIPKSIIKLLSAIKNYSPVCNILDDRQIIEMSLIDKLEKVKVEYANVVNNEPEEGS